MAPRRPETLPREIFSATDLRKFPIEKGRKGRETNSNLEPSPHTIVRELPEIALLAQCKSLCAGHASLSNKKFK